MDNNLSSLQAGTLLQGGKYRIVRFINSGGFGCTYEAEHVMLENRVAIKEFFVKDFCNRDETTSHVTVGTLSKKALVHKLLRKFVDEARAICKLHHPGIVTVSDIFEENGTAYFVMDYIEGRSLSQMVKSDGPLSEAKALGYIRQVAEALGYVHDHNRLHLDVKPGNIMVDASDRAILIDFGASKQYDEQDGENTSTLMGKTPGYAPLEQMGNDVVRFMPATDIYSLGATLYKLLTGITPLSANLLASGEELPPLPDAVSASTRRAIAAAMQINKNKRPQSIGEFLALLGMGEEQGKKETEEDEETKIDVDEEETKLVAEEPKPAPAPKPQPQPKPTPAPKPKVSNVKNASPSSRKKWGILLVVAVIAALVWMGRPSASEDVVSKKISIPHQESVSQSMPMTEHQQQSWKGPIDFQTELRKISDTEAELIFNATIDDGWYLYSSDLQENGPVPTTIYFEEKNGVELVGKLTPQGNVIESIDNLYGLNLRYFKGNVSFIQKLKFSENTYSLNGYLQYQGHNKDNLVLPPTRYEFNYNGNVKRSLTSYVSGTINGHDYVDLGLSVKWATCNVGASSPSDYGSYFAWGETKTKSKYEMGNSVTYNKNFGDISGDSRYDAARAHWGSSWRLPTEVECEELKNKCKWTWTTQGGHNGYEVVGPNGNSIFLPAAGSRYGGASLYNVGVGGRYWSSSPAESSYTTDAYSLYFYSGHHYAEWCNRYRGQSVRPVSE